MSNLQRTRAMEMITVAPALSSQSDNLAEAAA